MPPEELSAGIGLLHVLGAEIETIKKAMNTIVAEKTWMGFDNIPNEEAVVQLTKDCWQREIDALDDDPTLHIQKRQKREEVFW